MICTSKLILRILTIFQPHTTKSKIYCFSPKLLTLRFFFRICLLNFFTILIHKQNKNNSQTQNNRIIIQLAADEKANYSNRLNNLFLFQRLNEFKVSLIFNLLSFNEKFELFKSLFNIFASFIFILISFQISPFIILKIYSLTLLILFMQSKQSNQFDYLLPSPQLQSISTHPNDIIETVNNQTKRKVFQKVHFFTNQIAQIEKFRQFAAGKISQKVPDKTILRYLYSMDFKYEETLARLQMYLDWYNDPVIQKFDNNTRQIINSGFIYTYGRDKAHRPIIYMNLGKMDMEKHALQNYYSAVNAVVTLVVQYMFIKGKLEVYNFVIDTNQKSLSLPLKMCLNVMDKLGTVYSMRLGKMLLLNVNFAIKMMYGAATPFIHPITQAKIKLLSKSDLQQGKMTEFIDMNQLQQKYGGFRQNLTVNWPPLIPGQKQRNQTKYLMQYSFTQYFSVQNDADYFSEVDLVSHEFPQDEVNGCCTAQQCIIF